MSTAVLGQSVVGQLVLSNVGEIVSTSGGGVGSGGTVTVSALAGATPGWAPTLAQVGALIPTRTREIGVSNTYTGTFTEDTIPSADEVTILIHHACVWVEAAVGTPIMSAVQGALTTAAALRAAGMAEIAYPERDADVSVYDRFFTDSDAMVASAATANRAAGGGGSLDGDGDPVTYVSFAFPDPPAYADRPMFL